MEEGKALAVQLDTSQQNTPWRVALPTLRGGNTAVVCDALQGCSWQEETRAQWCPTQTVQQQCSFCAAETRNQKAKFAPR